jgi:hypothetical protein
MEEVQSLSSALCYKRFKPDNQKERLIELYSEHSEIPQEKFKSLYDELFEFSGNGSLTETEIKRLKEIETEINNLT